MRVKSGLKNLHAARAVRCRFGMVVGLLCGSGVTLGIAADQPRMRAAGIVVDESGRGVGGVTVTGHCIPAGKGDEAMVLVQQVTSSANGRFVVDNLPEGTCCLHTEAAWGSCLSDDELHPCFKTEAEFVVAKNGNVHNIRLRTPPPPEPTGTVSGRIVDADGNGLAGHWVNSVCGIGRPTGTLEESSGLTGSDGVFALTNQPVGLCRLRLGVSDGRDRKLLALSRQSSPCRAEEIDVCRDVKVVAGAERRDIVLRNRGGR